MSDFGKPCYKHNDGNPCYKKGGNQPVYKYTYDDSRLTMVTFYWETTGKDLDICAYWRGNESRKVGFGQGSTGKVEYVDGAYHLEWSGDMQGTGVAPEWCKIRMSPWGSGNGASRTFRVHFNYYGYDSSHTADKCMIIASQLGTKSIVKSDQNCSTDSGRAANTSDPYCDIEFDQNGNIIRIV